jgi:putative transcriptional regulator
MDYLGTSDDVILAELGQRIARLRLNRNLKQDELALEAGISRKTLSRLENGHPVDTVNFIRVLRALGQLDQLDTLLPPAEISPVDLARLQGRQRQRASGVREDSNETGDWEWPE